MATASSLPVDSLVVLLVDSHEDDRDMYAEYLRTRGSTVLTADTTDEGWRSAADADVIVTESRVSGSQRAHAAGCNVFQAKPCPPEQLVSVISEVVK
jgi:CheY-like chemotaxis protein